MSDGVEVIQVIRTTLLRRGDGLSKETPIRIITQYWSMGGELLWEYDPFPTRRAYNSVLPADEQIPETDL